MTSALRLLRVPKASPITRIIPTVLIGFLLTYSPEAEAQEFIDTRGREFYVTFLPNWHNDPDEMQDSLYLFLASQSATEVRMSYRDIDGNVFNEVFQLEPNVMFSYQLESERFELIGETRFVDPDSPNPAFRGPLHRDLTLPSQDERTALQHFHIEADEEITVYGLNEATFTSDAFAAFPVEALGTEYMILTYKTDASALSQFAVVATEDDTRVDIELSDNTTRSRRGETISIVLDEGESYLVQGRESIPGTPNPTDLTGTRINASAKVAVFSGHMRSRISYESQGISRDHLVQQLHAIPNWGGGAFVTPYVNSELGANPVRDLYRVLAARDNTDLYIDGEYIETLQAGQFREAEVTDALWITATGPVIVAQFKKTSRLQTNDGSIGDPFMIINSPIEQYMERHFFSSIDATYLQGNIPVNKFSDNQYITIIAPTESLESVRLDGRPIPNDSWKRLSITTYSYTDNLRVNSGTHLVTGDDPIGVYVYGYGGADSYGYSGGMRFREIAEFLPPDIIPPTLSLDPCEGIGRFSGSAHDTLSFDRGVELVRLDQGSQNVDLIDLEVSQPADSATFVLELQDPYQDGLARLISRDSTGIETERVISLPGFTVHTQGPRTELGKVEAVGRADGTELCRTVTLVNYGGFTQEVSNVSWESGSTDISITPTNFSLQPGETIALTVCASSMEELLLQERLLIEGPCASSVSAEIELDFKRDRNRPTILSSGDPCDGFTRNVIFDILDSDWGIKEYEILNATNVGSITIENDFLPDSLIIAVGVRTSTRITQYTIVVTDEAGNTLDTTITIRPVDIEFVLDGEAIEFGEISMGSLECKPLEIRNNSEEAYVLDEVTLRDNTRFSVPRSQLPLTIAPNSSSNLEVCFDAPFGEAYEDEIFLKGDCFDAALKLSGLGISGEFSANSNCGVIVNGRHAEEPGVFFVEKVFPNPTDRETRIVFGVPERRQVRAELFNSMGVSFGEILNQSFLPGIYDVNLEIQRLEQGAYFIVIDVGSERVTQQLNLIR